MSLILIQLCILIFNFAILLSFSFIPIMKHRGIINLNEKSHFRQYLALRPITNQDISNKRKINFNFIKNFSSNFINNSKLLKNTLFLFIYQFLQAWKTFFYNLRNLSTMRYVYVLECEDNKYYVGSTYDLERRIKQHSNPRGGSKWTKRYPYVKLHEKYIVWGAKNAIQKETQVTSEYMLQYGINNVRGAQLAGGDDFTIDDMELLRATLGHSLGMKYEEIETWIVNQLEGVKKSSLSPSFSSSYRRNSRKNDRCYRCNHIGHWAIDCPFPNKKWNEKWEKKVRKF